MFGFFSKPDYHGKKELDRFKELMSDHAIFEATVNQSMHGMSGAPFHLANKVQEAVNLSYSLTSMTSLNDTQIFQAVYQKKWSSLEQLVKKFSETLDSYKNKNSESLKSIIRWADRNNVPQLKPFDSKAYRQTGLPRNEDEMISLRFIHISDANLHDIPKEFSILPMVMAVCLSNNKISAIPSEICAMPSVYRLDLEGNFIEEIPEQISQMKQLQMIDLDGNNLMRIPSSLRSMKSLSSLSMRNQRHGKDLLSSSTPLSDDEVAVLSGFYGRDNFKLRT